MQILQSDGKHSSMYIKQCSFYLRSMTGNKTYGLTPRTPKTTSRNARWPTSGWSSWNTFLRAYGAKHRSFLQKGVCVCVNRAALSLPALHVQQARESSCLLPVQWLLPFTLFNMCNSHFLWLVSKRPRGKSALCGRLPNPSFRNDSTPQPPPPPPCVVRTSMTVSDWLDMLLW